MFIRVQGDWTELRGPGVLEVDFHRAEPGSRATGGWRAFEDNMERVREEALAALQRAQQEGYSAVLFTHGWSTSRPGKRSSRSVIRALIRGRDATPFVDRSQCKQHPAAFLAAIRPCPKRERTDD